MRAPGGAGEPRRGEAVRVVGVDDIEPLAAQEVSEGVHAHSAGERALRQRRSFPDHQFGAVPLGQETAHQQQRLALASAPLAPQIDVQRGHFKTGDSILIPQFPGGPRALSGPPKSGNRVILSPVLILGQVRVHHAAHQTVEGGARLPTENAAGFGGIAQQQLDLGRPVQDRVDLDVLLPVQTGMRERRVRRTPGRNGFRRWRPRSRPARSAGASATWPRRTPAHGPSRGLASRLPSCSLPPRPDAMRATAGGDFAGDELETAAGRFVIEEDAAAGVHPVAPRGSSGSDRSRPPC